jgi:hypothetical protein
VWLKLYACLGALAVVTFIASNALLGGPDPEGWWNYVPGVVFYGTLPFALLLPVVVAVQGLSIWTRRI